MYPRAVQNPLPVWIAVGGTPESAVRAGHFGLPMAIAIIGGMPERFHVFAELHRRAAEQAGHPRPQLSINSHGFIADTSQAAMDVAFPAFKHQMDRIGRERGWPPMTREQFEASCTLRGANFVGSPQQIIDKIMFQYEIFGHDRFTLQFTVGSMPHDKVMRSIELFGTQVAPVVRKEVARRTAAGASTEATTEGLTEGTTEGTTQGSTVAATKGTARPADGRSGPARLRTERLGAAPPTSDNASGIRGSPVRRRNPRAGASNEPARGLPRLETRPCSPLRRLLSVSVGEDSRSPLHWDRPAASASGQSNTGYATCKAVPGSRRANQRPVRFGQGSARRLLQ